MKNINTIVPCGNYLIGIRKDGKLFRCSDNEPELIIINQKSILRKNYYKFDGTLKEQFWSLPRTENAIKFGLNKTFKI